jgi:hypothetical protein
MPSPREVVVVDDLPVEVSSAKWAKDPDAYADEIREKRRAVRLADEDDGTRPPSYADVLAEHGIEEE